MNESNSKAKIYEIIHLVEFTLWDLRLLPSFPTNFLLSFLAFPSILSILSTIVVAFNFIPSK